MDLYYKNTAILHEVNDLHVIGVTCIFMANKFEEVFPVRVKTVVAKIAHNKI